MKFITLAAALLAGVAAADQVKPQMKGIVNCSPHALRCFVNCGSDGEKCKSSTEDYDSVQRLDSYHIDCKGEKCMVKCTDGTKDCQIKKVQSYAVVDQTNEKALAYIAGKAFA